MVLVEDFTYAGTLGILRRFGADIRGVESDGDGMLPDSLEYRFREAAEAGKRVKAGLHGADFSEPARLGSVAGAA